MWDKCLFVQSHKVYSAVGIYFVCITEVLKMVIFLIDWIRNGQIPIDSFSSWKLWMHYPTTLSGNKISPFNWITPIALYFWGGKSNRLNAPQHISRAPYPVSLLYLILIRCLDSTDWFHTEVNGEPAWNIEKTRRRKIESAVFLNFLSKKIDFFSE